MAYTRHVTLVAATVATVDLGVNATRVEVFNRDGADEVFFTTDESTPTVAGNNTHALPAAVSSVEVPDETDGQNTIVKLISPGTPKVSVRAL